MFVSRRVKQSVGDSPDMETRRYWEENRAPVKYENFSSNDGFSRQSDPTLNFATGALASEDDTDYPGYSYHKKDKLSRQQDPMSHRIIEKRRRDRMNNCLADLSRLIPADYLKKGRGRVEKTEIIEMAIRRLQFLQERTDNGTEESRGGPISLENYRLGYQECRAEVMRYLVEVQGYLPTDSLCVHLVGHLQRHCDNITKGNQLNRPRSNPETSSSSGSSGHYGKSSVITALAPPAERRGDSQRRPASPSSPASPSYDHREVYTDAEPPISALRHVRRPADSADHHYKYKNTIKQRFSQDCDEAQDMSVRKRLRGEPAAPDAGAQSEDPPEPPAPPPLPTLCQLSPDVPPESKLAGLCVPVFALNALGKYYVPLNVNYECLTSFLGSYDLLHESRSPGPLHPVSINVNFQPYLDYLKPKEDERPWDVV